MAGAHSHLPDSPRSLRAKPSPATLAACPETLVIGRAPKGLESRGVEGGCGRLWRDVFEQPLKGRPGDTQLLGGS